MLLRAHTAKSSRVKRENDSTDCSPLMLMAAVVQFAVKFNFKALFPTHDAQTRHLSCE